eukprot:Rmarinus@m.9751
MGAGAPVPVPVPRAAAKVVGAPASRGRQTRTSHPPTMSVMMPRWPTTTRPTGTTIRTWTHFGTPLPSGPCMTLGMCTYGCPGMPRRTGAVPPCIIRDLRSVTRILTRRRLGMRTPSRSIAVASRRPRCLRLPRHSRLTLDRTGARWARVWRRPFATCTRCPRTRPFSPTAPPAKPLRAEPASSPPRSRPPRGVAPARCITRHPPQHSPRRHLLRGSRMRHLRLRPSRARRAPRTPPRLARQSLRHHLALPPPSPLPPLHPLHHAMRAQSMLRLFPRKGLPHQPLLLPLLVLLPPSPLIPLLVLLPILLFFRVLVVRVLVVMAEAAPPPPPHPPLSSPSTQHLSWPPPPPSLLPTLLASELGMMFIRKTVRKLVTSSYLLFVLAISCCLICYFYLLLFTLIY